MVVLAFVYFGTVATWNLGSAVYSSAEGVADGRVWLLLTSALEVDGDLPGVQLALTAGTAVFVIAREGPRLWWLAALIAHVVSALYAYGVIGLADLLGSDSAERAADDPDYGISCVLVGSLGALFASGLLGRVTRPRPDGPAGLRGFATGPLGDQAALVAGAAGLLASLTVAFGWYDMEHPIAFVLGAGVVWLAHRRDVRRKAQHRAVPGV